MLVVLHRDIVKFLHSGLVLNMVVIQIELHLLIQVLVKGFVSMVVLIFHVRLQFLRYFHYIRHMLPCERLPKTDLHLFLHRQPDLAELLGG